MAGLDLAIHQKRKAHLQSEMDARVKPAHDEWQNTSQLWPAL
jgi:hypothetical protein